MIPYTVHTYKNAVKGAVKHCTHVLLCLLGSDESNASLHMHLIRITKFCVRMFGCDAGR